MPVNGWQFRTEQQQDPALARIPVVVMSAFGAIAKMEGMPRFVAKPISLDRLLDTVQEVC